MWFLVGVQSGICIVIINDVLFNLRFLIFFRNLQGSGTVLKDIPNGMHHFFNDLFKSLLFFMCMYVAGKWKNLSLQFHD